MLGLHIRITAKTLEPLDKLVSMSTAAMMRLHRLTNYQQHVDIGCVGVKLQMMVLTP